MSNQRLLTDTKEIEINGVKFVIGIINRKKWMEFSSMREMAFRKFRNLFLALQSAVDPSKLGPEELQKQAVEISRKATEGMTDEEIHKANMDLVKAHWEMIRYGVKSHSGLLANEKEIPFIKDDLGLAGDDTIGIYELRGYFTKLAEEVRHFNEISEGDKKN